MRLAAYEIGDATPPDVDGLAIGWEECACSLCGGTYWISLIEGADPSADGLRFQIVKCNHCGLCFTNPRPDSFSIRQFYPSTYHCYQPKGGKAKDRFWRADPMRKLLPVRGKARLLDFGCGAGDFLQRMHTLGWNVLGMDPEEMVALQIQDRKLPILTGSLPSPLLDDGSFEAITMLQSLEHVHDPLDVLRDAYRLLVPTGRLLVTTPNLESLSARWFGPSWYGLDLPRHLTHFTPDTLRGMLQRAGFDRIDIRHQPRPSWIRQSARLARKRRGPRLFTQFLETHIGSRLAGWVGHLCADAESILAIADKE